MQENGKKEEEIQVLKKENGEFKGKETQPKTCKSC